MLILHPTQQPLVPTRGPADWQAYLADPEKHWKEFAPSKDAEDPFDALVGLLSMLDVLVGYRAAGAPSESAVATVEGWILERAHPTYMLSSFTFERNDTIHNVVNCTRSGRRARAPTSLISSSSDTI